MAKAVDLTGQKFNRLTVIERDFEKKINLDKHGGNVNVVVEMKFL